VPGPISQGTKQVRMGSHEPVTDLLGLDNGSGHVAGNLLAELKRISAFGLLSFAL
jgi:hypothetical protein